MDIPAIRLECFRIANQLRDRGALGDLPLEKAAETLVMFCDGNKTRLQAMAYAYKDTGHGSKLAAVMERAKELADFSEKTPAPVHQPSKSTRGGRSRGERQSR